uniref:Uncharacterized protein n=1 Tax=Picea glauca TaxID=3330 RepID=A0A101LVV6_PICGL|nr:hypothetical protein ABT39_MTgene1805 [Picea glauca]
MGESVYLVRRQAQRYPINVVDMAEQRKQEWEKYQRNIQVPRGKWSSNPLHSPRTHHSLAATLPRIITTSHLTRIFGKQYLLQLEDQPYSWPSTTQEP